MSSHHQDHSNLFKKIKTEVIKEKFSRKKKVELKRKPDLFKFNPMRIKED